MWEFDKSEMRTSKRYAEDALRNIGTDGADGYFFNSSAILNKGISP